jgi:hypothetical protein
MKNKQEILMPFFLFDICQISHEYGPYAKQETLVNTRRCEWLALTW